MPHEGIPLPSFTGMESHHGLTHHHVGPFSHSPDITHFQMPGMNHNISLMGKEHSVR